MHKDFNVALSLGSMFLRKLIKELKIKENYKKNLLRIGDFAIIV